MFFRSLSFTILLSTIVMGCAPFAPALATTLVDPVGSIMGADKASAKADGIDNVRIGFTIKDTNFMAIEGTRVTLTSSRGIQDEIIAEQATTDLLGHARFLVRSLRNGTATFSARIGDVLLQKTVTVTFHDGLSIPLEIGDLIKIPDDGDAKTLNDTAVYHYASNGKRYVFPNEKVYFTWYPDFSKVKIIPNDQMSLIPIGGNITYKPGSRLVKFQTDPKTYLVTRGGVLRWAKTEPVARGWFGATWNQMVDDISEAFYVNYRFGLPVESSLDLPLDIVRTSVSGLDDNLDLLNTRFP